MSRMPIGRMPGGGLAAGLALGALTLASCEKAAPGAGDPSLPAYAGEVELVELFAPWNPACRMQAAVTGAVAEEYEGLARITRIDVEAAPEAPASDPQALQREALDLCLSAEEYSERFSYLPICCVDELHAPTPNTVGLQSLLDT